MDDAQFGKFVLDAAALNDVPADAAAALRGLQDVTVDFSGTFTSEGPIYFWESNCPRWWHWTCKLRLWVADWRAWHRAVRRAR